MADTKKCTGKTSRKRAGMWLCFALGVTLCLLSACASSPRQKASALGQEQGFSERLFSTKLFTLYGLLRPGLSSHSKILRVYIEGDGHAWESAPGHQQTPRRAILLPCAWLWLIRGRTRCFIWRDHANMFRATTNGSAQSATGHQRALGQR